MTRKSLLNFFERTKNEETYEAQVKIINSFHLSARKQFYEYLYDQDLSYQSDITSKFSAIMRMEYNDYIYSKMTTGEQKSVNTLCGMKKKPSYNQPHERESLGSRARSSKRVTEPRNFNKVDEATSETTHRRSLRAQNPYNLRAK